MDHDRMFSTHNIEMEEKTCLDRLRPSETQPGNDGSLRVVITYNITGAGGGCVVISRQEYLCPCVITLQGNGGAA